jgi:hypothetical protein
VRDSHDPYFPSTGEDEKSTFTIPDHSGKLAEFLNASGFDIASDWINVPPIYHIDVKTTKGAITTPFSMTNSEFDKVPEFLLFPFTTLPTPCQDANQNTRHDGTP